MLEVGVQIRSDFDNVEDLTLVVSGRLGVSLVVGLTHDTLNQAVNYHESKAEEFVQLLVLCDLELVFDRNQLNH